MMKLVLALIIIITGAKYISSFGSVSWAYEKVNALLQTEEAPEKKSDNEKNKFDHGDNLYFVATRAPLIFEIFATSQKNSSFSESFSNFIYPPKTPPPDLVAT